MLPLPVEWVNSIKKRKKNPKAVHDLREREREKWREKHQTTIFLFSVKNGFGNMSMASIFAGNSHDCGLNVTEFLVCKVKNGSGQLNALVGSEAFEYSQLCLGANHSYAIRGGVKRDDRLLETRKETISCTL